MKAELLAKVKALDPTPLDADMPAGAWSAAIVLSEVERRMSMDTQTETRKPAGTGRQWRGPLVAAAAFVAVIVGVGAVLLALAANNGDLEPAEQIATTSTAPVTTTVPPTTTAAPTTTVAVDAVSPDLVADAFFAAMNGGDVDAVVALFADDAVIGVGGDPPTPDGSGEWSIAADDFEAYFAWTIASLPTVYEIVECDVIDVRASCRVSRVNELLTAVLGEAGRQVHIFDIEDGVITQYYSTFSTKELSLVIIPFFEWARSNHPESLDVVWRDLSGGGQPVFLPIFTEESALLYQELVAEYLESL